MTLVHLGQGAFLPPRSAGSFSSSSQKGQVKSIVLVTAASRGLSASLSARTSAATDSTSVAGTCSGTVMAFLQTGQDAFLPARWSFTLSGFWQCGHLKRMVVLVESMVYVSCLSQRGTPHTECAGYIVPWPLCYHGQSLPPLCVCAVGLLLPLGRRGSNGRRSY